MFFCLLRRTFLGVAIGCCLYRLRGKLEPFVGIYYTQNSSGHRNHDLVKSSPGTRKAPINSLVSLTPHHSQPHHQKFNSKPTSTSPPPKHHNAVLQSPLASPPRRHSPDNSHHPLPRLPHHLHYSSHPPRHPSPNPPRHSNPYKVPHHAPFRRT